MEGTSNMFEGSSRSSRSGSQNRARARASRILQPPEKVLVGNCCLSGEKPRPARMVAARGSALSDSISLSLPWMSPSVVSRPSRSLSSLAASLEVSAIDFRCASISESWRDIFWNGSQQFEQVNKWARRKCLLPVQLVDVSSRRLRPRLLVVPECHLQLSVPVSQRAATLASERILPLVRREEWRCVWEWKLLSYSMLA